MMRQVVYQKVTHSTKGLEYKVKYVFTFCLVFQFQVFHCVFIVYCVCLCLYVQYICKLYESKQEFLVIGFSININGFMYRTMLIFMMNMKDIKACVKVTDRHAYTTFLLLLLFYDNQGQTAKDTRTQTSMLQILIEMVLKTMASISVDQLVCLLSA